MFSARASKSTDRLAEVVCS